MYAKYRLGRAPALSPAAWPRPLRRGLPVRSAHCDSPLMMQSRAARTNTKEEKVRSSTQRSQNRREMRRAMRTAIWVLPVLAGSILSPTRPNIKPTAPKIKPSFADVPLKKSTTIPLRIDGEWYDAGGWADEHPGGRWLLEYARGRDVTALFHSIHLRARGSTERALQPGRQPTAVL